MITGKSHRVVSPLRQGEITCGKVNDIIFTWKILVLINEITHRNVTN